MKTNAWLMAATAACVLICLMHVACALFGGDWYRILGAGEAMAVLDEQGSHYPMVITFAISLVLLVWAAFAASGAGLLPKLPLVRTALLLISACLLARGLGVALIMPAFPDNSALFWWVSSSLSAGLGGIFAIGLYQEWPRLSPLPAANP